MSHTGMRPNLAVGLACVLAELAAGPSAGCVNEASALPPAPGRRAAQSAQSSKLPALVQVDAPVPAPASRRPRDLRCAAPPVPGAG